MSSHQPGGIRRRGFLKGMAMAVVSIPVVSGILRWGQQLAHAEALKPINLKDPAIKNNAAIQALGYTDSSPKKDQNCKSCALFTQPQSGHGVCPLFPMGLVSEKGWCKSFAAKPK